MSVSVCALVRVVLRKIDGGTNKNRTGRTKPNCLPCKVFTRKKQQSRNMNYGMERIVRICKPFLNVHGTIKFALYFRLIKV